MYDTKRACRREDTTHFISDVLRTTGDPNGHLDVWIETETLSQQYLFELFPVLFVINCDREWTSAA